MRIGLVSQWYPPEVSFITGNLAAGLAGHGHEVRVLTTFPSYPLGHTFPGYRQSWFHRTEAGGVVVRRVPAYPSHDRSGIRRAASYLSFGATSSLVGLRYLAGVDVVYVYHPPPTSAAIARVLRATHHIPYVLHVQDLWPDVVTMSGMAPHGRLGRWTHRSLDLTMRWLYESAGAVVAISPTMAQVLIDRGVDPARVRVVFNWTDDGLFRPVAATPAARSELGHTGRCTIMFAGNLGLAQGIETAVRAAAAVDLIDLVLVGSGEDEQRARDLVVELGATNVRFLGRRPPQQMAELYAVADYQLICLRDESGLRGTIPSKLQAALACGVPVVVSVAGDAAHLVRSTGSGLICPPGDWRALADQFIVAACMPPEERLAMGRRARVVYQERMSLSVGLGQFEEILTKVATNGLP